MILVNSKTVKNKHKITKVDIILGLILVVIVFLIILLFSYAHFQVETINNVTTATVQGDFECLDVSFNQTGAINLNKNYPVTDDYALANFTPIEATVTNNCSTNAVNYVLSLSSIYLKSANYDTGYIPDTKIRVKTLKQVGTNTESSLKGPVYLSNLSQLDRSSNSYKYISNFYKTDSSYTNYNLKNTYKVDSSSITANTTVKYKIYLWIDYYEGAPNRVSNDEYNNSTQGLKFSASAAVTLNIKEKEPTTFAGQLIESGKLWQSELDGDGYRYVGSGAVGTDTNPDNFICFGTTSKPDCTTNQDKYMYRIIGVFADKSGNNHIKLIKYKKLGEYAWNEDPETDVSWENSDLYKGLNGNYFLTNTTYDYMQNTTWNNRIENWTWSAVNSMSYENEGDNSNPFYTFLKPLGTYINEMNLSTTIKQCISYNEDIINCNGGTWTTPSAKIGLMYYSDYTLSLGSESLKMNNNDHCENLTTSWIHQSDNGTVKNVWEWTMARMGDGGNVNIIWEVPDFNDCTQGNTSDSTNIVRPVFYLTSEQELSGGDGSLNNPYILK